MKFHLHLVADVWAGHFPDSDLRKFQDRDCPFRLGAIDGSRPGDDCGHLFWVPLGRNGPADDRLDQVDIADWAEHANAFQEFGLSDTFVAVVKDLRRQSIPYFRVDSICEKVDGL